MTNSVTHENLPKASTVSVGELHNVKPREDEDLKPKEDFNNPLTPEARRR